MLKKSYKERREQYEKIAVDFKQDHQLTGYHHFRRLQITLSLLKELGHNLLILDAGCGDGVQMERYAESNRAFGMDISITRLRRAEDRLCKNVFFLSDLFQLPIKADTFDVVILGEVIEHLDKPDLMLSEIHRVLKPSGHLILDTPSKSNPVDMLLGMFGVEPKWGYEVDKTHLWFFNMGEVVDLLEKTGYSLVKIRGGSFIRYNLPLLHRCTWVRSRWWVFRLFDLTFGNVPILNRLGAIQVFMAKKA